MSDRCAALVEGIAGWKADLEQPRIAGRVEEVVLGDVRMHEHRSLARRKILGMDAARFEFVAHLGTREVRSTR